MNHFWCSDKKDLNMFIQTAMPNDMFIYYRGYLNETLLGRAFGKEIYDLAVKGLGYLVRKRSREYIGFDYFFIKASKRPNLKLVPLSDEKLAELDRV